MLELNKKALLTCTDWFLAPDGHSYKGVFGTVKSVKSDDALLGVQTNRHSTNWYVEIGNMTISGCRIDYAIRTDEADMTNCTVEDTFEGKRHFNPSHSSIYNADETFTLKKDKKQ